MNTHYPVKTPRSPRYTDARLLALACALLMAGCSDVPKAPPQLKIEPATAAQKAMEQFDANKDGKLDAKELEACPPLRDMLANLKRRDSSHADALTADDIAKRIGEWLSSGTTLMSGGAKVSLDGKPLEGATVTFEPEPLLGPDYHPQQGTTNAQGGVTVKAALENYPGIYVGLYRIKITKTVDGKELVPEKYNAKTTLGCEIAPDGADPYTGNNFNLTSKP